VTFAGRVDGLEFLDSFFCFEELSVCEVLLAIQFLDPFLDRSQILAIGPRAPSF
jgi:hypothetical protein